MEDQFASALATAGITIVKFDLTKQRPVSTNRGTMTVEKFSKLLIDTLNKNLHKYPEVVDAVYDFTRLEEVIREHAKESGVLKEKVAYEIPEIVGKLTLNRNMAAKSKDDRYFLTNEREQISPITGEYYIEAHGLKAQEANALSRAVIPEYRPRSKPGVSKVKYGGEFHDVFNLYIPPVWVDHPQWDKLPTKSPPELFKKLIHHLFPLAEEREFFYDWLHDSLFKRAFTFLILCGAPGTGKNRLKLVMRALHGFSNSADGKKSTLSERFNSQLDRRTLLWFDELRYDMEMENTMKELQNDSLSIERKGIDTTGSTKIYASVAISNNKERDNYIAFDARKFAPLLLTNKRLEESMTNKEIDELTKKVEDESKKAFDPLFLAQIAKWLKERGNSGKWPNNEYKGPMFWALAHTSMSRWQKKAAMLIIDPKSRPARLESSSDKGFKWSELAEKANRKNGDRSLQFPDFTTVRAFFEVFRDGKGRKAFETSKIAGDIMGDFYVKSLFKQTVILTETIEEKRGKANGGKEKYDL